MCSMDIHDKRPPFQAASCSTTEDWIDLRHGKSQLGVHGRVVIPGEEVAGGELPVWQAHHL